MNKKYNKFQLIKRGFKKKCPICGEKPLFSSYLKIVPKCSKCNINFTQYSTDDGPAYCTIFIVGHFIIAAIVFLEGLSKPPPMWIQLVTWPLITIILSMWLLPKIKGAFLAFQIGVKDRSS